MENSFKKYVLFWFSGSVSQLGSAMTSFAVILWAYARTGSAMTVSLMAFCSYLPYILISLVAGRFVDHHYKKHVILSTDFLAALCSLIVLLLWLRGGLSIWHLYLANAMIGMMNSFQMPAQSVAIGLMVPRDRLAQTSGMDSFSSNLVTMLSPVFASMLFAFGGLGTVILVDLLTFIFAFVMLLVFIRIPETLPSKAAGRRNPFFGCADGFRFLFRHKGLWSVIITMAVINFFSRLTYENILSPMILARSGNDSLTLGIVNMALGAGGLLGGLFVSFRRRNPDPVKMIYLAAAISFLFGDLLMGFGRNIFWWSIAGLAASVPIPFVMAGQRVILYSTVPQDRQGSVFAVRNAIQYCTIPLGILLGGLLADQVFEPFVISGPGSSTLIAGLRCFVGTGKGSGMAVMFLCTGLLGSVFSVVAYRRKEIQKLRETLKTI